VSREAPSAESVLERKHRRPVEGQELEAPANEIETVALPGGPTAQSQSAQLFDGRFPTIQRQALAARIGRLH